jgi:hypothetical protein
MARDKRATSQKNGSHRTYTMAADCRTEGAVAAWVPPDLSATQGGDEQRWWAEVLRKRGTSRRGRGSTIEQFRRRNAGILLWSGSQAEQNPGEVVNPIRASQPRPKGVLNVPDLGSRDRNVVLVRRILSSGKPQGVGNLE